MTADECGEEPPASGGYTLLLRCLDLAGSIGGPALGDQAAQPAEKELSSPSDIVPDGRYFDARSTGGVTIVQPLDAAAASPR